MAFSQAESFRRVGLPAITMLVVLVLWEVIVRLAGVPKFVLPPPSDVLRSFVSDLASSAMWGNLGVTTAETLLGFAAGSLLGVGLGVLIAEFRIVDEAVYPLIVAFQAMPKVAIAPLLLLWFGFGIGSKIAIAALLAFFPLLVNTVLGLHASDTQQEELMQSLAANRWQTFVMVRLRNALPSIFAGLELAMVFSVIGAIVGEFVGARAGLGYMIQQRDANVDVAGVLSVLLILGIFGAALTYGVKVVAARVVFWTPRKQR
jgi:NitT/TauT family transport system permease protein